MGKTIDINVPRELTPVFPKRCIRCGHSDAAPVFRVAGYTSSWARFLFWWWLGKKHTVYVPACGQCKPILQRNRLIRNIMRWVVILGAIFGVGELSRLMGWSVSRLTMLLSGFGAAILFEFLLSANPEPLDITVFKNHVTYEFRDRAFAQDFVHVNSRQDSP